MLPDISVIWAIYVAIGCVTACGHSQICVTPACFQHGHAVIDLVDDRMSFQGRNSVIGRSVVVHALRDDLGRGGDAESLISGNAGARIACGVIGLTDEVVDWNV